MSDGVSGLAEVEGVRPEAAEEEPEDVSQAHALGGDDGLMHHRGVTGLTVLGLRRVPVESAGGADAGVIVGIGGRRELLAGMALELSGGVGCSTVARLLPGALRTLGGRGAGGSRGRLGGVLFRLLAHGARSLPIGRRMM